MKVYVPVWFWIMSHSKATDGERNFWYLMLLLKDVGKKHAIIMKCVLPKTLNFNADDYSNMIDWEKETVTQPPV